MFRYIDDVLSINNSRFGDFVDRIYPIELEIKDTTYTHRSASYLDLHLEIDSEGRLRTKRCGKRDDFNFPIVNFPFICSNIPPASCIWSIYLSDDTIFQSLWFLSRSRSRVSANKEATEPRVPFGKVEVITSKNWRSPPWFGWQLWNICVTNDHGYVPLVVNTSRSFPHSWLITGLELD